jgi:uncharacterized membrane protein
MKLFGDMKSEHTVAPRSAAVTWADKWVNGFLRHWLLLLLAALFIFVGLPFLAPAAMAVGWASLGEILYFVYAPFCHQLPQRSWFLFGEQLTYSLDEIYRVYQGDVWSLRTFYGTPEMGWKVAWSDRMISFYTMVPVFGLVYAALRRVYPALRPIPWQWLLLAQVPLFVDGITHALNDLLYGIAGGGFRDTNAWLAFLSDNAFAGFYAGDHLGTFNWWARLLTGLLAAWGIAFFVFPWLDALFRQEQEQQIRRGT